MSDYLGVNGMIGNDLSPHFSPSSSLCGLLFPAVISCLLTFSSLASPASFSLLPPPFSSFVVVLRSHRLFCSIPSLHQCACPFLW